MRDAEKTEENLWEIMAREIAGNPHAEAIIGAFQPLLLARRRLLAAEKWPAVTLTGFDPAVSALAFRCSARCNFFPLPIPGGR